MTLASTFYLMFYDKIVLRVVCKDLYTEHIPRKTINDTQGLEDKPIKNLKYCMPVIQH